MKNNEALDMNKFNDEQKFIIEIGSFLGLSDDQIKEYANPDLSWNEMHVIQKGLLEGYSGKQLQAYCNEALGKELVAGDKNASNLISDLTNQGYEKDAQVFFSALVDVDELADDVDAQKKYIENLEQELDKMKRSSLHGRMSALINEAKKHSNYLVSSVNNLKKQIVLSCSDLHKKASHTRGALFCGLMQKFMGEIKNSLIKIKNNNEIKIEQVKKDLDEIRDVRRNLQKRNSKHKDQVIKITREFGAYSRRVQKIDLIVSKCLDKVTGLEKSFGDKARENRRHLSNHLSDVEKRKVEKRKELSEKKQLKAKEKNTEELVK